jgi:predicted DNA-binding WGR domain protein
MLGDKKKAVADFKTAVEIDASWLEKIPDVLQFVVKEALKSGKTAAKTPTANAVKKPAAKKGKSTRSFEFNDNKSSKFWTIEVSGNSYTVKYGKIGTNGQTASKEFDSDDACQKAADKVIKEKLGKGYVEK